MSQTDDTPFEESERMAVPSWPPHPTEAAGRKRLVPPGPHEVGYGRPPVEHQFRPGQSGNPKGRPKGSKNMPPASAYEQRFDAMLLEEVYREVEVPVGGEMQTITKAELGLRALITKAAKGHVPAMRLMTQMTSRAEARRAREQEEAFREMATFKIEAERELERRRRLGLTHLPEIIPHPDHIKLEFHTGTVRMEGPLTREQKDAVQQVLAALEAREAEIAGFAKTLALVTDPELHQGLTQGLERMSDEVEEIRAQLPAWATRIG